MKNSLLTFGSALLCAGVVLAFSGKNHVIAKSVSPQITTNCDSVFDPSPSVQCNDGFRIYGNYSNSNQEYGYVNCACDYHRGPNPLLPY